MRPDRGFTLLETLLALLIGGLVLTSAYAAVVRAAVARDGATRRTAGAVAVRRALLDLTRALETAAPRPFSADAGALRIAQTDPAPRVVRWSLDDGRLLEWSTPAFAPPRAAEAAPRVVLDGVQTFDVRCFDGRAWVTGWQAERAPRAVEVALALRDGESLRTRVVLPLGGNGG
jgi:prepilin-type N-terminal cleavage/methylation domain-containing protein